MKKGITNITVMKSLYIQILLSQLFISSHSKLHIQSIRKKDTISSLAFVATSSKDHTYWTSCERIQYREKTFLFHSFMNTYGQNNSNIPNQSKNSNLHESNPTQSFLSHNPHSTKNISKNINTSNQTSKSNDKTKNEPNHIAIILDGNGRWAKKNNVPISIGHTKGASRVISTLQYLKSNTNVQCCTLYAFSTENWSRSYDEIQHIWNVIEQTTNQLSHLIESEQIHFQLLGHWKDERIPSTLVQKLWLLQTPKTDDNHKLMVALAINYGGRQDIIHAAQRIVDASIQAVQQQQQQQQQQPTSMMHNNGIVQSNHIPSIQVNEDMITSNLSTANLPPLDMVIRTGGEQRMSNFLLWDAAYAELYFTDQLWPDFDDSCLKESLNWYSNRERRFGGRRNQ